MNGNRLKSKKYDSVFIFFSQGSSVMSRIFSFMGKICADNYCFHCTGF